MIGTSSPRVVGLGVNGGRFTPGTNHSHHVKWGNPPSRCHKKITNFELGVLWAHCEVDPTTTKANMTPAETSAAVSKLWIHTRTKFSKFFQDWQPTTVDGSLKSGGNSPVEVGSFSPIIYRVSYIPGGCLGFQPSTVGK